jgi:hypothetical protein
MEPLQEDNAFASLDPQVALVNKALHPLVDALSRAAILHHLGHKRATLELSPMVKSRLYLFFGAYPNPVASLQLRGCGGCRPHGSRSFAPTGKPENPIEKVIRAPLEFPLTMGAQAPSHRQFQAPTERLRRNLGNALSDKLQTGDLTIELTLLKLHL